MATHEARFKTFQRRQSQNTNFHSSTDSLRGLAAIIRILMYFEM
jgi:hypothetical protein